ncbi:MAG: hypothetical protein ABSG46_00225 [Candidatus Binataceae bacterium]
MDNGNLSVAPKQHLTPELPDVIRANKPCLVDSLRAEDALALLARLKGYTLPGGRLIEARELIVRRARELIAWDDGELHRRTQRRGRDSSHSQANRNRSNRIGRRIQPRTRRSGWND